MPPRSPAMPKFTLYVITRRRGASAGRSGTGSPPLAHAQSATRTAARWMPLTTVGIARLDRAAASRNCLAVTDDKVILSCALTGAVTTKKHCPAIPYTPVEIAEEARRAHEAGAA